MLIMKKITLTVVFSCFVHLFMFAQDNERLRIAVFDPASSGTSIDEGTKIAVREIISSTIVNTGMYNIVERSLLEKVMQEQQFTNSGAVDDLQATEVGKLAGANKIILSVVTLTGGRNMLSVKIIDVKTASVDRQKVKVVTSGELLDAVEPLTLEMLELSTASTPIVATSAPVQTTKPISTTTNTSRMQSMGVPNGDVFFYGVDFSAVKIYGAYESNESFAKAFTGINEIFVVESEKFNFGRLTNRYVSNYPIPANERNGNISWSDIRTSNPSPQKQSIENMIRSYRLPHQSGKGIVMIAWVLNKSKGKAIYELVIFDIPTRKILYNAETIGDAGGAGLRNYWANSVYSIISDKRLKKEVSLVF